MIFILNLLSVSAIWSKAWPILLAILFFGFIITIHEFGHFIVAKLSGVKVNEFAIGMGPAFFKFKKGETQYALRILPIGGYVSMEGEDENSEDERAFNKKPVHKKIAVVAAGAVMNLILGLVLVCVMISQQNLVGTTTIAAFAENATSSQYGLQPGDKILRINGTRVLSSMDVSFLMTRDDDGVIDFTVERNGEKVELDNVKFQTKQVDGINYITYDFSIYGLEKTPWNVFKAACSQTVSIARLVWLSLFDLITGRYGLSQLAGPVGTVSVIAEVATTGIENLISIFAFITINIGVFNLLPLPALDGGRLFFLIVEAIRRKPVNPKYEGYVHAAGMVLLLMLMVVVTFNDILNLVKG